MRSFWNSVSLQTKITVFIVVVVISVLTVSTYISRMLTEQKAEELLRERYINIVKQIDASIVTFTELRDTATLEEELAKLLQVRPNIVLAEIFDLSGGRISLTASTSHKEDRLINFPDPVEVETVKRGEVIAKMERQRDNRFWHILAPILIKKEIAGLIRARISTREFDTLVTQERWQAFLATMTAATVILVFLVWYLRQTISNPIRILVNAMAQAEAGNLESQVRVHSQDELGKLVEQFNQMLRKIREGTERIQHFNEELQIKIQQATEELSLRYEELMRVNRQLSETQLQLAHSQRLAAAGQVTAAVAHRIGTPLHSILGHLHRVKRETSMDKREERLKIIEGQVQRVVHTIQEFLDFARKPSARMQPIQINKLLEEVLGLIMPVISLREITLKTRLEPGLPDILGDGSQLQEAFLNLLTNAMDAMPAGGEIGVTTGLDSRRPGGQFGIFVTISDTGCGIPTADLSKIFEPFFTTKERSKGTGLGLSICREIIKAHRGEIQVSSRLEVGTTFTIVFPVH